MLLKKANTITTPTAYSNGFLHSVKPEVVLGEELVTNGDFSQSGTATTSSYSLGWYSPDINDVVISSGVMTIYNGSGGGGRAYATDGSSSINIITSGKKYRLTYTVVENNGVSSLLYHNGGAYVSAPLTLGTHTIDYTSGGSIFLFKNNSTGTNIVLDNVSLKERLDADFTFTRNSSATRVNELGYIEDVQIIGGELSSNGNFEQIGSELVTNGSFSTDSDWVFIGTANISGGTANFPDTTNSFLIQNVVPLSVKQYRLQYEVVSTNGGNLQLAGGSSAFGVVSLPNTLGVHTVYLTSNGTQRNLQFNSNGFIGSIDNVSVKEVGQDWTFFGDVTMGDGLVSFVSPTTTYSYIRQDIGSLSASNYRISIEVKNYVSGAVQAAFFGASTTVQNFNVTGDGVYTVELSPNANGDDLEISREFSGGAFDFDIDNISVKEVTDDTNLPRINYEGFTYAESLGNNLVVNGTFDNTNNWTAESGVVFTANGIGTITSNGSFSGIYQSTNITFGKTYRVSIKHRNTTSAFRFYVGNTSFGTIPVSSDFTTTTLDIVANGTVKICYILVANASSTIEVDNVSVQEVIGNLPVPYSGKGHLLLEGQRTNLVTNSEYISGITTIRATINLDSSQPSPTNDLGVYYLTATSANGLWYYPLSTSGNGVFSVYLKRKTGVGNVKLSVNGGVNYTNVSVTNEWERFSISTTSGLGQLVVNCETSGDEVYLWGLQAEEAIYTTSYIPTNGTAVTRLGETCNNATHSFPSEGVLYAEIAALADDGTDRRLTISDGTFNNNVQIIYTAATNQVKFLGNGSGVTYADFVYTLSDVTEYHKFAFRYKDNDFSFWIDGVQVGTDTSGTAPTGLSQLQFANTLGTSNHIYGKTKMVATFPYLSNDEMECLTGEGYGTFEALAAAYSYTII